jgi:hypothetical protein
MFVNIEAKRSGAENWFLQTTEADLVSASHFARRFIACQHEMGHIFQVRLVEVYRRGEYGRVYAVGINDGKTSVTPVGTYAEHEPVVMNDGDDVSGTSKSGASSAATHNRLGEGTRRIAIVIPAGGGKSTLAAEIECLRDIDTYEKKLTPELRDRMKAMRREALVDPTKWTAHNNLLWSSLKPLVEDEDGVFLVHGVDEAVYLFGRDVILLTAKPDRFTHARNISARDREWQELSRLNWAGTDAVVIGTNEIVRRGILAFVRLYGYSC